MKLRRESPANPVMHRTKSVGVQGQLTSRKLLHPTSIQGVRKKTRPEVQLTVRRQHLVGIDEKLGRLAQRAGDIGSKLGSQPVFHGQCVAVSFDASKATIPDNRHRMLLHHSFGILLAEQVFGPAIPLDNGRRVFVRDIGAQHVLEDLGFIPTPAQCLAELPLAPWMAGAARLRTESPPAECDNSSHRTTLSP